MAKREAFKATKILKEEKKKLTNEEEKDEVQSIITILGRINSGRYMLVDQQDGGCIVI